MAGRDKKPYQDMSREELEQEAQDVRLTSWQGLSREELIKSLEGLEGRSGDTPKMPGEDTGATGPTGSESQSWTDTSGHQGR